MVTLRDSNKKIPYSYPIRMSTAIVIVRIIGTQFFISVLTLFITLPLVAFKETIDQYIPIIMLYSFLMLCFQMLNMIVIVLIFLRWMRTIYITRENEIIEQKGIWNIKENIYATQRVEEVEVDQSLWGRLWNYGTVKVSNPLLQKDLYLIDIPQPHLYADVIRQSRSKEEIQFIGLKNEQNR